VRLPRAVVVVMLGIALAGCGDVTGASSPGGAVRQSPLPTLPPEVPERIRKHVEGLLQSHTARRVDRIGARMVTWGEFQDSLQLTGTDRTGHVWVVAATGEFAQDRGLVDMALSPCKWWVFDAGDLTVAAGGGGPLSSCARYIAGVPVPPDAPVACGPEDSVYSYRHGSAPIPGQVVLAIARDDAWRLPATVPGWALYEGINQYETYCRSQNMFIEHDAHAERMLRALGSPNVRSAVGQAEIWLKNFHAIEATANDKAVRVLIEPRPGFEIASFDWRSVAPPGANYVRFEFVDRSGRELSFTVANGP
jgi:hypothetical protein